MNIVGAIVIPLLLWRLEHNRTVDQEERKELLKDIQQKINNRAVLVERKIELCEMGVNAINEKLKHRADIASLKYNIIKDKIEDLESYLEKVNGYRRKGTKHSDRRTMPTLTDPDTVDTEIF